MCVCLLQLTNTVAAACQLAVKVKIRRHLAVIMRQQMQYHSHSQSQRGAMAGALVLLIFFFFFPSLFTPLNHAFLSVCFSSLFPVYWATSLIFTGMGLLLLFESFCSNSSIDVWDTLLFLFSLMSNCPAGDNVVGNNETLICYVLRFIPKYGTRNVWSWGRFCCCYFFIIVILIYFKLETYA